ncbi:MAG: efflux RND transporter periplasmic adaptor subunit [Sphingomonadales bacterium]|nr:efflux RND transporter periplasmic adaptor subunit [Sphingomonadales bacterium]
MTKPAIIIAVVGVVAGGVLGFTLAQLIGNDMSGDHQQTEKKILYWTDPMLPGFKSDKPGKSPMGMDMIPVYEGEASPAAEPALEISPAVEQNIGLRTAKVVRESLPRTFDAIGTVAPDDDRVRQIDVRSEGWVEVLRIKTEGEAVKRGDLLFRLYSPPVVNAQAEYLQARRIGQEALTDAARRRLEVLGVGARQIERIAKTGAAERLVDVHAPQDGVVVRLNAGEGQFVQPGMPVMALADLSAVWVMVEVYEDQVSGVMAGDAAMMQVASLPGRSFTGRIDYVYPTVTAATRTVRLRLKVANADGLLKPNMYATVTVIGKPGMANPVIPREALIRSAAMDRVVLALGDGRFRPAKVVAGREAGAKVEILKGLAEGETVVTSAQFLLDSEASVDAGLLRLATEKEEPMPAGHHHH